MKRGWGGQGFAAQGDRSTTFACRHTDTWDANTGHGTRASPRYGNHRDALLHTKQETLLRSARGAELEMDTAGAPEQETTRTEQNKHTQV